MRRAKQNLPLDRVDHFGSDAKMRHSSDLTAERTLSPASTYPKSTLTSAIRELSGGRLISHCYLIKILQVLSFPGLNGIFIGYRLLSGLTYFVAQFAVLSPGREIC